MSEIQIAIVSITGTLLAVWFGAALDRRGRRSERQETHRREHMADVSKVLGDARMTLNAMNPRTHAGLAEGIDNAVFDKRREECDLVRPELTRLSISWAEASDELVAVSNFLGIAPNMLQHLVRRIVKEMPYEDFLERLDAQYHEVLEGLERVVSALREDRSPPKRKLPLLSVYWSEADRLLDRGLAEEE